MVIKVHVRKRFVRWMDWYSQGCKSLGRAGPAEILAVAARLSQTEIRAGTARSSPFENLGLTGPARFFKPEIYNPGNSSRDDLDKT